MQIEYEATFTDVDKDEVRERLRNAGATLDREEHLQKRIVFNLPESNQIKGGWLRVRDEGNKITMSLKIVDGEKIEDQKELCLKVDNYDVAVAFLQNTGCEWCAYQETKRELWILDEVEVTIDTWPFLVPFVEVEGVTKEAVKAVSETLGFNWEEARFCSVDTLYAEKYNLSLDQINNHTPKIVFDMENPFSK